MKLPDHVNKIRNLIEASFDKQFARLGIGQTKELSIDRLPSEVHSRRNQFDQMLQNHIGETGSYESAREKLLDELTFTLFNRIAAIKAMEASNLFPPIITKQSEHGDRSFGHKAWLEDRPDMRSLELEGIREYIKYAFNEVGKSLPLYSADYPYALLPDPISLNDIIDTFNEVEKDDQIDDDIWKSDDLLGWLYESYNNAKKQEFKDSKSKTEFNKVSLQSQVYTPSWVVKFLVENSLGKLYLEMYPNSEIKDRYKIANVPTERERDIKPLHEVKLIDPASGSGNFLLYAFDFFYELYLDQIENYGADYDENDIPKLIIENNLHGIDLDDRAIQLAQLGLYIKARKKSRIIKNIKFNVVSSDFYLPDYSEVKHVFEDGNFLEQDQKNLITDIWKDLKYAYKFGSLIRIDEKLKGRLNLLKDSQDQMQPDIFAAADIRDHEDFAETFFSNLKKAVEQYATTNKNTFISSKTRDAITFLELLSYDYDVATANPPYTDSSDFGPDLKAFIQGNYKKPYKFHTNLYTTFIKRCHELTSEYGKIAMIHPDTFMFIKTFEDVRKYILSKTHINIFIHYPQTGGVFGIGLIYPAFYVLEKGVEIIRKSTYINIENLHGGRKEESTILSNRLADSIASKRNAFVYSFDSCILKKIKSYPIIYWISEELREIFSKESLNEKANIISGIKTGNNNGALRYWWEVDKSEIYDNQAKIKWVKYTKGGPSRKWFGNNWLCINLENDAEYIKTQKSYNLVPQKFTFLEGISYSGSASQGISFRFLEKDTLYDMGSSAIFPDDNLLYTIAMLNSKLIFNLVNCLNPTVNKQPNDVKRIPIPQTSEHEKELIANFSEVNININKRILSNFITEMSFKKSPIENYINENLERRIHLFFIEENYLHTIILLNQAIIDNKAFELYKISNKDKAYIISKEGQSIGLLPITSIAKKVFLLSLESKNEDNISYLKSIISNLPITEFDDDFIYMIKNEFLTLYQNNNNLETFCIKHQVNPINVWYWFKESNVIPKQRMNKLAMEFLADMLREILLEDEDGIIPLIQTSGQTMLLDRIEAKFIEKDFTMAQFSSFDSVLAKPLKEYLDNCFFQELSDHLNLFQYLPKTPFIWHLSSGEEHAFDCYIIIYKWSRDKLMRLRSVYVENREGALRNKQSDLSENSSASAQNEKDKIHKQLLEIESFKQKIDELLAEGYDPKLDDGVGKNIAPLQKKKMIPYDVLNPGQLKKYLNADW